MREKLEFVDLEPDRVMDQMPSELSGGMKKRVGIARGMANNPEIMLYDEPTSGLDPLTTATITHLILKLQRELERHERRRLPRHAFGLPNGQQDRAAERQADSFFRDSRGNVRQRRPIHSRIPRRLLKCAVYIQASMKRSTFITWDQLKVGAMILVALAIMSSPCSSWVSRPSSLRQALQPDHSRPE